MTAEGGSSSAASGARSPADSLTTSTTTVLPEDTNAYGNLFGGHLVALIDKAASITASRHCRQNVVTASIDRVDFIAPVKLGDILTMVTKLTRVGRTSMVISSTATAESRLTGEKVEACRAVLTFVAVGPDGKPTTVPALCLDPSEERATD